MYGVKALAKPQELTQTFLIILTIVNQLLYFLKRLCPNPFSY